MSRKHFGDAYSGSAPENYERYFVPALGAPLAADLVYTAALHPGERVLDVACGTGIVARLAAEGVGPSGTVTGVDLNPGMLAVARTVTPSSLSIQWYEASAEAIPLPHEAFDVVLCQMGLQFMSEKAAAVREMRRVLVPGGRLLINVPGPTSPVFATMDEALERHIGPEAAGFVRVVFSLHDPDEIRTLVDGAGFQDVDVRVGTKTLHLPAPEEFLWQYVHCTPLAGVVAQAGEENRVALERDVVTEWRAYVEDGGFVYEQGLVVATARK